MNLPNDVNIGDSTTLETLQNRLEWVLRRHDVRFVALSDEPLLGVMAHTTYQIQVLILHPHLSVMAKLHLPVCRVLPIMHVLHIEVPLPLFNCCRSHGGSYRNPRPQLRRLCIYSVGHNPLESIVCFSNPCLA